MSLPVPTAHWAIALEDAEAGPEVEAWAPVLACLVWKKAGWDYPPQPGLPPVHREAKALLHTLIPTNVKLGAETGLCGDSGHWPGRVSRAGWVGKLVEITSH